jgi:hypothetical protein
VGIGIKKVLENVKNGIPYKLLVLFHFLFLQGLMRLCLALAYCIQGLSRG